MEWKTFFSKELFQIETGNQPFAGTLEKALRLEKAQQILVAMVFSLVAFGVVMIYSSSAIRRLDVMDTTHYLRRQILWVFLGMIIMILFWHTDYRQLLRHHKKIFLALLIALVLVLIPGIGSRINGARRWIRIAGIGIQPSEIAKLVAIIFCAAYVTLRQKYLPSFKEGFLPIMIPLCLMVGLILIEPDFGTAMFILLVSCAILVAGGMPIKHFLPFFLAGLPFVFIMMFLKFDHIKSRLLVFLYPEMDPFGKGHQIRQSLIALGSGGFGGLGIGASRQKLFFLPEDHTDFILAIIGEELGFWGCALIIGIFISILFFGKRVMNMASGMFGHFLAFGITFAICLQGVMNIAVVTASMPTKGISLPLVSFGGSSMLAFMAALGILLNIAKSRRNELCLQLQNPSSQEP